MNFPLAGQTNILEQAYKTFSDPRFKELPQPVQESMALAPILGAMNYEDPAAFEQRLKVLEESREREARRAQQLGKESLWEAGKAAALFKTIPQSISNAFGASAAMQLAAAERIPATYGEIFRSIPRPQIQGAAISPVTQRYYS